MKPGPDGYRQFTESIRRAFNLPDDSELNITFTCDEPSTGQHIRRGGYAAWPYPGRLALERLARGPCTLPCNCSLCLQTCPVQPSCKPALD